MTLKVNNCSRGGNGSSVTLSTSGGINGDAFDAVSKGGTAVLSYSSTQTLNSPFSHLVQAPATTDTTTITWNTYNDMQCAVRVFIRFNALPSAAQDLVTVRNSGAVAAKMQIGATNKLVATDAAGTGAAGSTMATAFSINTWYRIEMWIAVGTTTSTGAVMCAYYLGNSLIPQDSVYNSTAARNTGTTPITNCRFGKITNTASTIDSYWEGYAVDSGAASFIGPYRAVTPLQARFFEMM